MEHRSQDPIIFVLLLLLIIVAAVLILQNMQRREATISTNQHTQDITATALSGTETAVSTENAGIATSQANIAATQTTIATVQVGNDNATATATANIAIKQGEYLVTDQSHPLTVKEGQTFQISFTLKNIGLNTWSSDQGYQLVCIDDVHNIPCPPPPYPVAWCSSVVPPNQSCEINITLTAPTRKGVYKAEWQLQHNKQSVGAQDKPYMYIFITVE